MITSTQTAKEHLILLPGLLNDAELWRDQLPSLSQEAWCHVGDITQRDTVNELAEDILAQAPERFSLAAFSLGGFVAIEMARLAPERIVRLALLDTSIRADTTERAAMRRKLEQTAAQAGRFHGFGEKLLDSYLAPSRLSDKQLVERIRAMTGRLGLDIFLRQSRLDRRDGEAVLRSLQCPIQIVCGEQDTLTPLSDHSEMANMNLRAELSVIPASGHLTPMENPSEVTQALLAWLRRQSTS